MLLADYLNQMTTYGRNDLPSKLRLAGIKTSNKRKAEMVRLLSEFLSKKENILTIWNSLNRFDKEFLEEYIRANGRLDYDEKQEIIKKYNRKATYSIYGTEDYFDENSKARLLFIKSEIPFEIFNIIKELVKPIEYKLMIIKEKEVEKDSDSIICINESFEKDFLSTAKLANNLKLKTTKENGYPTKGSAIKLNEMLENKEIILSGEINDIRNYVQTTRIFGIISLMLSSKIIKTHADSIIPGKAFDQFMKIGTVERCKMLLEAYIDAKDIDELSRIKEIKAKTELNPRHFQIVRQVILQYIAKSPVCEWIEVADMLKYIKKTQRDFLRNVTGEILTYDDYERYYNSGRHGWNEIEGRFVEVLLIEYLSTIGIVDVSVCELDDDYGVKKFLSAQYFRLTKLGAYVLNVIDEYESPNKNIKIQMESDEGFTLQANFEIIVQDSNSKYKYCMFFDKFAEKVVDDIATIYKLSFKSMVTALDKSISINEIIEYIQNNCKNLIPENVMITLRQWEKESKRIKIRKVTIVETDDNFLIEELKSYRNINNNILGHLNYAFEIDSSKCNKVKREIEKKNKFCVLE